MPDTGRPRSRLSAHVLPGSTTRRRALLGVLGVACGAYVVRGRAGADTGRSRQPDLDSRADWQDFTARFIAPEGRVVDTGNGGVTHSEGQGYGLLFAEHFGDRPTFDRLLGWTRSHLGREGDALHAWRYRPDAAVKVDDANNATDGDLLIAWALLRAGARWGEAAYHDFACAMGDDLLRRCTRKLSDARVLLPASFGFEHPGHVVVNPSYYVFPAMQALGEAMSDPAWETLRADGLRLLQRARFGQWGLPPDWVQISGNSLADLAPAPGWPARFAWDAVRVPLNLAWGGLDAEPALQAAAAFWGTAPGGAQPAWVDLGSGAVAPYAASAGMRAVAQLAAAAVTDAPMPDLPRVDAAKDYYSAALVLLARVAAQETFGVAVAA